MVNFNCVVLVLIVLGNLAMEKIAVSNIVSRKLFDFCDRDFRFVVCLGGWYKVNLSFTEKKELLQEGLMEGG